MERLLVERTAIVIAPAIDGARARSHPVFDRGRVVEEGDHAHLLPRRDGIYRRLLERGRYSP